MTTTPWWINLIVVAVGLIVPLVAYRTGCKHGYARGHEDGRKAGGTEVANMINGMRAKPDVQEQREAVAQSLDEMLEEDARAFPDHAFNRECPVAEDKKCRMQSDNNGWFKCQHCGRDV